MCCRGLRRLPIHPHISDQLQKHGISNAKDILSKTHFELLHQVNLSSDVANELLHDVAKVIAPVPTTALDLLDKRRTELRPLPTTLAPLDSTLRGGVPAASVTEVCGPAGCGKTQLCAMLAVIATLPKHVGGLDGSVLYIDTEHALTAERIAEIAASRFPDYFSADERRMRTCVGRIFFVRELDCQALVARLERLQEDVMECDARLVVLDSVAALARKDFDGHTADRTALLTRQAAILKRLAEGFGIPVVVTNHVTTRFSVTSAPGGGGPLDDADAEADTSVDAEAGQRSVTAALGMTWAHCVNTRIILQYFREPLRQLLIAKSPVSPFCSITYTVDRSGLCSRGEAVRCAGSADPCLHGIVVRGGSDSNTTEQQLLQPWS